MMNSNNPQGTKGDEVESRQSLSVLRNAGRRAIANTQSTVNYKERVYIPQGFVGILRYDPDQPEKYLATSGMSPCVGLTSWQEGQFKVGLLAHLDSSHTLHINQYVALMLKAMQEENPSVLPQHLQVTVAYSSKGSVDEPSKEALLKALRDKGLNPIELQSVSPTVDILLDLATGKIREYQEKEPNIANRRNKVGLTHPDRLKFYELTIVEKNKEKIAEMALVVLPNKLDLDKIRQEISSRLQENLSSCKELQRYFQELRKYCQDYLKQKPDSPSLLTCQGKIFEKEAAQEIAAANQALEMIQNQQPPNVVKLRDIREIFGKVTSLYNGIISSFIDALKEIDEAGKPRTEKILQDDKEYIMDMLPSIKSKLTEVEQRTRSLTKVIEVNDKINRVHQPAHVHPQQDHHAHQSRPQPFPSPHGSVISPGTAQLSHDSGDSSQEDVAQNVHGNIRQHK